MTCHCIDKGIQPTGGVFKVAKCSITNKHIENAITCYLDIIYVAGT